MSRKPSESSEISRPRLARRVARLTLRWLWRGTKAVALLLLVSVLVGSTWVVWTNHRGQVAAENAQGWVQERGLLPVDGEELPDSLNGARFYLAASQLLVLDEEFSDVAPIFGYSSQWPLWGDGFSEEQHRILQQVIEPNQIAFDLIREARRFEQFEYGFQDSQNFFIDTEIFGDLRRTARWLVVRNYLATANQDPKEAVQTILDIFSISRSLDQNPSVLSMLIQDSITNIACSLIEETLSRMTLKDASLVLLQEVVAQNIFPHTLAQVYEGEATRIMAFIQYPDLATAQVRFNNTQTLAFFQDVITRLGDYAFEPEPIYFWVWASQRLNATFYTLCPGLIQIQGAQAIEFRFDAADLIRELPPE